MCVMLCEEVVCLMHLRLLEDPRGKSKQAMCHVAVSNGQVTHPSVLQPAGCLTKPKGGILYKGINIFPQEDSAVLLQGNPLILVSAVQFKFYQMQRVGHCKQDDTRHCKQDETTDKGKGRRQRGVS